MLQLNAEQISSLQTIQMERDTRHLCEVLGSRFPEIPARLAERYPALIAHGVQRGAAWGLTHALCVARYLACWFVLGAEFETKPGFEWAHDVLADTRRMQGAKVFQLCRRTRETMARLAQQAQAPSGPMSAAAFDQAISALDDTLMDRGILGGLQRGERVVLGQACDIDAIDLRLVESDPARRYVFDSGQWQRVPYTLSRTPVTLAAGGFQPLAGSRETGAAAVDRPPVLPERLAVLSHAVGSKPARLRLRTLAGACCDPQVHPLVVLNSPQGLSEWRGPQAGDISLDLYADTPAAPAAGDALQPVLAMAGGARLSVLSLSSCALRDSGAAMGEQSTQIAVHPAEQHLMAWRREPVGELNWPEPSGTQPTAPAVHCRIERDGLALDVSRWQAGLQDLDRQLAQGLARLFRDWERVSGVSKPRMSVEPAVMCGDAGLSWGWAEGPLGMLSSPYFRIIGRMELMACQLNLRLSGELEWQGALGRLSLYSHGREHLQSTWERSAADTELLPTSPPTSTSFSQPFVLQVESVAQAGAALLDCGPVSGAIVGSCGLRARGDGMGLQWFAKLDLQPAQVTLHWHEPLLGLQTLPRLLLPAIKLLDWSLG